jgi:hypothetical protein
MPENLPQMIEALATMPTGHKDWFEFCQDLDHLAPGAEEYFRRAAGWFRAGIVLPVTALEAVAALWKHRPDLREVLVYLVHWYPCREFLRPFFRAARRGGHGAYVDWFTTFPELRELVRPGIIARARRVNTGFAAIDAALLWARLFDGGDEAYRHVACAIHRNDVRESFLDRPSGFLRHDLEQHGTVSRTEAARINEHLLRIKNARLLNRWP